MTNSMPHASICIPGVDAPAGDGVVRMRPRGREDLRIRLVRALDAGRIVHVEVGALGRRSVTFDFIDGVASAKGGTVEQEGRHAFVVYPKTATAADPVQQAYGEYTRAVVEGVEAMMLRLTPRESARLVTIGGRPDQLADRLMASLPLAGMWDESVGPFYDAAGVMRLRRMSRQALRGLESTRDVLVVRTTDGVQLYPSFQFTEDGTSLPSLRDVIVLVDPGNQDPWGAALWLNARSEELDFSTPAEALRDGRRSDVIDLAYRIGSAWSQ